MTAPKIMSILLALASAQLLTAQTPPQAPKVKKPALTKPQAAAVPAAPSTGDKTTTDERESGAQVPTGDARLAPIRSKLDAWETAPARRNLDAILDRSKADHLVCLGRVLFQEQKYGESLTQFRTASEISPADPEPWLSRGITHLAQQRDAEAKSAFDRAYSLARDLSLQAPAKTDARGLYLLGVAEQRTKRYPQSLRTLRRAREANPEDPMILYQMGLTYAFQESWNEAVDFLTRALAIDSGIAYAYYYRGLSHGRQDRKDLLITDLTRFLQLAPDSPEAPRARKLVESASH